MRTRPPLPLRPGRRRLRAAPALTTAALLAALALSGCSGGTAEEAEPAPLSTAVDAGASASADPSADPSAGPTEQVVTTMTTFSSPTGNISCYLAPVEGSGPYARCDIAEKTWEADPPEAGCAGDWGGTAGARGSVGVGDDEAAVLCATDTVASEGAQVLQYGSSIRMDDLTCVSADTGMACDNSRTGRGFTVSKARHVLR